MKRRLKLFALMTGLLLIPAMLYAATRVSLQDGTGVELGTASNPVKVNCLSGCGGASAPDDATYITQTANGTLSAEQALSSLSTGIMRVATTTGVITSLTDSSGIAANLSDETGSGALVFGTAPVVTLAANSTIPSGANPTIDAAGEIGIDTSATTGSAIRFYGDATYTLPAYQRTALVLDTPTSASDYEIGSFPANFTIKAIRVLAVGGTNIIGGLQECDANGLNCVAVDSDITATAATTATDDGSLTNPTIDAGDQLQWLTTSVSGSVTRAVITIYYVYDAVN